MGAEILSLTAASADKTAVTMWHRHTILRLALPEELGVSIGHFADVLQNWPTLSLSCAARRGARDFDMMLRLSAEHSHATLAQIDWVYVARPQYLLEADFAPKCDNLDHADLRFVLPDYAYAPIGASSVIVAASAQDCVNAALQGIGIAAMPRALVQAELMRGQLIALQAIKPDMPQFLDLQGPALDNHTLISNAIKDHLRNLFH